MSLSPIGSRRLLTQAVLFFVNIVVLALAARVNGWQEFFFVADLLPLALSIITLVVLTLSFFLDVAIENPFTGRAPFEIGVSGTMSLVWLIANSFSTSRWRHVPLACSSIPSTFSDEITWCKNLQALKSFIWIEWLVFLFHTFTIVHFALTEHNRGNKHIWTTSLARYNNNNNTSQTQWRTEANVERNSEFLQFEKVM